MEGHRPDGRADLFALGIVMYQLVCGVRPFDGDTDAATVRNILAGKKRRPSELVGEVSPALEAVIWRALELNPKQRFRTAREMAVELREYLIDAGSLADREALARLLKQELAREKSAETEMLPPLPPRS
jgi:serine/threonine protein kinase